MLDITNYSLHPANMPRTVCLGYPNAIYHLGDCGDRREALFLNNVEPRNFLGPSPKPVGEPDSRYTPFRLLTCLWLAAVCALAGSTLRAELVLTNYTATNLLKVMPIGDSITDDCAINGAWRLYLQPLLQNNGYAFTNLGRWASSPGSFTKVRHEGICGAVIAFPGMFSYHTYPVQSNYALKTVADALTNTTPDLFLIDLGVNDMGYGRNPWLVATNDMAALLDLIFARVPSAQIIVGKPTSITRATIGSPAYSSYGTNMHIFCAALQSLVNTRRAQGQNVFMADLFSAVDPNTLLQGDGTHPNAPGFNAMAKEWSFRIAAMTVRTDQVVTPFIGAGSTWKYSDQGLDLGTNWAQLQYDDSAWARGSGRLGYNAPGITTMVGYGPDSTNKYITTYFRQTFVVPANVHYTNLNVRLNRADGAVVWLNGQELFRVNLPSGPVSFLTRATLSVVGDPLNTYYPSNRANLFLPAGTNLLAVEIHKASATLPNLSFDLELFGFGEFIPSLAAALNGTDFTVRWPATNHAGFLLISGTNLSQTATWAPLGGPYLLNGGSYQYREPVLPSLPANFYTLRYVGLPATGPSMAWVLSSNTLALSWPTDFAGFNLETSTNLLPAGPWQTIAGPYYLTNGSFGVSVPSPAGSQQFFRLRKPLP
jgi:lysophospholipase L1-like esterase